MKTDEEARSRGFAHAYHEAVINDILDRAKRYVPRSNRGLTDAGGEFRVSLCDVMRHGYPRHDPRASHSGVAASCFAIAKGGEPRLQPAAR